MFAYFLGLVSGDAIVVDENKLVVTKSLAPYLENVELYAEMSHIFERLESGKPAVLQRHDQNPKLSSAVIHPFDVLFPCSAFG